MLLPLLRSVLLALVLEILLALALALLLMALHPPAIAEMLHQRTAGLERAALSVSLAPRMKRWLPPPPPLGPPGNEEQERQRQQVGEALSSGSAQGAGLAPWVGGLPLHQQVQPVAVAPLQSPQEPIIAPRVG